VVIPHWSIVETKDITTTAGLSIHCFNFVNLLFGFDKTEQLETFKHVSTIKFFNSSTQALDELKKSGPPVLKTKTPSKDFFSFSVELIKHGKGIEVGGN
jgi:hypothetical protein